MMFPVGYRITRKFGMQTHPITKQVSFHNGIDIAMPLGTLILAPFSGRVRVFENNIGGLQLIISGNINGKEVEIGFAHLSRVVVRDGDEVKEGDKIAYSGNTGRSTGAHLHLTMKINKQYVDPLPYYLKQKYV